MPPTAPAHDAVARLWHVLSDADLARFRFRLMRELAWIDWAHQEGVWWAKVYRTLLEVKRACALGRKEEG